ncbi:flagellar biosynthesis anti-sigma factor FlgM [Geobacter pickeringii]|uniref:Negative regulator of flagellin synthesis n=1 Tax=Geobacter pickeringii TaxID=345632 RepID=A0A0B5BEB2_9BACT|nr:flagellar biosynthesis anti-sigma factor FlgM [Geobacter pickeringii]AJE02391.1 hypothetical protein GPICK_02455 [Geobacter pickeringii]
MTINSDIVSLSSVTSARTIGAPQQATEGGKTTAAGATTGPDRVELSLGRPQVDRLKQAAAGEPEFRADKVAAVKQQIQEGTYQIDSRAVAAKIAALHG